jgi:tRNA(fMet)-specific endonuclease VapC
MVVLDTDSLSILQLDELDESELKAKLQSRLDEADPTEIATTIVTYEEQTRGWMAYKTRAKNESQEIKAYAKLRNHVENYRTINVLDFDQRASAEFQRLRHLKIRIGTMDLKIAATVLAKDATLLKRNLVDFRKVPGLKAEDWTT